MVGSAGESMGLGQEGESGRDTRLVIDLSDGICTETGKQVEPGVDWGSQNPRGGDSKLGWWISLELGIREGVPFAPRYRLSPDTC